MLKVPPFAERHAVLGIVNPPVERGIVAFVDSLNVPFCKLRPPPPIVKLELVLSIVTFKIESCELPLLTVIFNKTCSCRRGSARERFT